VVVIGLDVVGVGSDMDWLDGPTPLIGLMGTAELQHPIVSNIPNAHGLRYVRVSYGHYFPKRKPKRVSYEGYEPNGILPAQWVRKHKHQLPAVLVVLMEWDDSKQWDLQEATLASAINRYQFSALPLCSLLSALCLCGAEVPPVCGVVCCGAE
jgi:hypothetical protein